MAEMHASRGAHRETGGAVDANLEIVSVADILNRRVALEWFEPVAIVAGLCSALVKNHATGVPAPRDIVLTTEGTINLAGPGRAGHEATIPRLLHALLEVAPPSAGLRLFVLHAISSDVDKSPATFGEALAYYERPGRDALIRAARQKCLETPPPLPGSSPLEGFERPEIEKVPERPSSPTRRRGWLVVAGLATCACAIAVVVAVGHRGSGRSADVFGAVDEFVAYVSEAGSDVAHAIAEELPFSLGEGKEAIQAPTMTQPPAGRSRSSRQRAVATTVRPDAVAAAAPTSTEVLAPAAPFDDSVGSVPRLADADGIEVGEPLPDRESTSVVPPRLLDPVRLPPQAEPILDASLQVLELDISAAGRVERAKLVSPATRMTDMMILSAAKTWMFAPASIDGRPIPYRLTLRVAPIP